MIAKFTIFTGTFPVSSLSNYVHVPRGFVFLKEEEREGERSSIPWFIPQIFATVRIGSEHLWWRGSMHWAILATFPGISVGNWIRNVAAGAQTGTLILDISNRLSHNVSSSLKVLITLMETPVFLIHMCGMCPCEFMPLLWIPKPHEDWRPGSYTPVP